MTRLREAVVCTLQNRHGACAPEVALLRPQLFSILKQCKDFQELSFQLPEGT